MGEHTEVRVQAAVIDQAGAISDLHCRLFAKGWDADGMRRLLEHPACVAFAAFGRENQSLVGFIIAQMTADEAEILSVGVDRMWQRQGVGRALVEALTTSARGRGAQRMFLDVGDGNTAAQALYARLGFRRMGLRKDYYVKPGGRREDAVLMVLDL